MFQILANEQEKKQPTNAFEEIFVDSWTFLLLFSADRQLAHSFA